MEKVVLKFTMEKNYLSPRSGPLNRPMSPLKSPQLRRHFAPIQANISYPSDVFGMKHSFKQMKIGDDGYFRASVDVHDYKPEEISLKTVGHTVIVELSHGDKQDEFGTISRNFTKKFVLPLTMDMEKISSWTSQDVLYVKVPPKESEASERVVEIKHNSSGNEGKSA